MIQPVLKYLLAVSLALSGCSNNSESLIESEQRKNSVTDDDIYSFMNYLMYEGILTKDYKIKLKPEEDFGYNQSVDSILYQLEIKENQSKETQIETDTKLDSFSEQLQSDSLNIAPEIISYVWCSPFTYPEVLTREDSEFIKSQIANNRDFLWDNDRLGFLENSSHWYQVSVPCFSRDKKYVIILIRSLCPGLCGTGNLYLFTKKGIEWESQSLDSWFH